MKANLRARNRPVDTYISVLIVTLVGSAAALFILHVALDVPFKAFASPQAYAIDSSV